MNRKFNTSNRAFAFFRLLVTAVMLVTVFGPVGAFKTTPVRAATSTITLSVVSARTEPRAFGGAGVTQGDAITQFQYIINVDNTGTTDQKMDSNGNVPFECSSSDPAYPANCKWTSIAGVPGSSPIYTQGDQSDFSAGMTLPDGRYLISVLADGYKLDGVHFTIPSDSDVITVELQPFPLPEATIRAWVFEDISPTNSAPDAPIEHGLAGFQGHIADYIGEVTTDVYGNPLCTLYEGEDPVTHVIDPAYLDADYLPIPIPGSGGRCLSEADGMLVIPHVGPNRYALSAVAPDGSSWIQTTTLEGNHDWDAWVMEGATGYDTEFVVAGEPFPAVFFGFVQPTALATTGSGEIKGVVAAAKAYIPGVGGINYGGLQGWKIDHPIDGPWISLSDLTNGDTAVYIGQGNPDGSFNIQNVPDGNYTLAYWDEPQDYILDLVNVSVSNGEVVDLGVLPIAGWWTTIEGHVFNDLNRNGIMDAGEPGLANFPVSLKKRENSLMDRGAVTVTTDQSGYYYMENAYPMTQWLVEEAYSDLYYTTGITFQADNQLTETTVLGAGVDVSVLPIIGLGGRLDWGVHAYDPTGATGGLDPRNGGIVGTVSYDTTRNELDPRYAAVEAWQPGISNLTVNLYAPVVCGTHTGTACDALGQYELASDGSLAKGQLLNTYTTETWQRPKGCVARDVNGDPLSGVPVLPTDPNADCLEGPLMGVQFGPNADPINGGFGATVDGNYGFGDGCFGPGGFDTTTGACADLTDPTPLTSGDYLVDVQVPNDALGRPLYQVTREEDINIFNGDQFIPQIPPPACVGPLHTVDVAGVGTDGYGPVDLGGGVTVPASTPVDNPAYADAGGSYYEGQPKPLCSMKLVRVSNGRSIAPTFNYFTNVPLPGRFWGLIVDDLNFSSNPQSLLYGEKAGVPFAPVGIYDYTNRLVYTTESDYNGLFDVLLPSSNRINCPTPSGVCANLYRFVGNDPGIPGRLNTNYNPQFRTIAAEFEAIPGLIVPADLAPTQMASTVQLPGGQTNQPVVCAVSPTTPQLFAVSSPYVDLTGGVAGSFTITGQGFGTAQGQILLGTTSLPVTAWSDTQIAVSVPVETTRGSQQLSIQTSDGQTTINSLTFHVLGDTYAGPFPTNGVLDSFNRTSGGLGTSWGGDGNTPSRFSIQHFPSINPDGVVQVRNTGNTWWLPTTFGANQEAYFKFIKISTASPTGEQALLLKFNGSSPNSNGASWIEVSYNTANGGRILVRTKVPGQNQNDAVTQATFPIAFATGDQLGARAFVDGTVVVYKNGIQVGSVNIATTPNPWPINFVQGGGRIGVRFVGPTSQNDARFDDFGGGDITAILSYQPEVFEVGSGKAFSTIQGAIDAAAAQNPYVDSLVVVYPGTPDPTNPRYNPRGAYYENLIISTPIKLQGVGPGSPDGSVPGSIIDGSAYGGDTALADAWRAKIATMTWVGNQTVSEGETIYLLAQSEAQYGATFNASIDGFDIRGGDQQGQANILTQGGAIFANAYIRDLQITNNVIENNSASYGTVRIGTPDLPAPDTSQHNEGLRISNNRILANGSTNLAGAIGIFAGADGYEVAYNDICGNFSAEYGGGLSVYGYSPNGMIHDNRVYFNQSYDEGGGIIIAGELPADPSLLSPGSGLVDIYNNLIEGNLSNDDGGGLRFLMAGNYPMNVYNNMIVNNVSTHEGGGISLNDAPDVRFYNNTIAKNITTATAVTSNGQPAPAGLSTSANSTLLQATLPAGSPTFSSPLMFNNIYWDNRAGTLSGGSVVGIGAAGDATPINNWDVGIADPLAGVLDPDASDLVGTDPMVFSPFDITMSFVPWRTNPNFVGSLMVAINLPGFLVGDYHIQTGSPAIDFGVPSKASGALTINAPAFDFDNGLRPTGTGFDAGADEVP